MATIHEITEAQTCVCNAKCMPFAACCKVRKSFEAWYDKQADGRIQPFDVWLAATNQAQAEFDALAADAARYRWLRSAETGHCKVGGLFEVVGDGGQFSLKCTEELDAAIDAAMKGE